MGILVGLTLLEIEKKMLECGLKINTSQSMSFPVIHHPFAINSAALSAIPYTAV